MAVFFDRINRMQIEGILLNHPRILVVFFLIALAGPAAASRHLRGAGTAGRVSLYMLPVANYAVLVIQYVHAKKPRTNPRL
jgi:hypothetical protein